MQRKLVAWTFVLAGMVFLVTGAMPLFRGQRGNLLNLALAIALLLIGAAIARKSTPPSA